MPSISKSKTNNAYFMFAYELQIFPFLLPSLLPPFLIIWFHEFSCWTLLAKHCRRLATSDPCFFCSSSYSPPSEWNFSADWVEIFPCTNYCIIHSPLPILPPIYLSECSEEHQCDGLGEHAHFKNFGMAFLTLFRIATGGVLNAFPELNILPCY